MYPCTRVLTTSSLRKKCSRGTIIGKKHIFSAICPIVTTRTRYKKSSTRTSSISFLENSSIARWEFWWLYPKTPSHTWLIISYIDSICDDTSMKRNCSIISHIPRYVETCSSIILRTCIECISVQEIFSNQTISDSRCMGYLYTKIQYGKKYDS